MEMESKEKKVALLNTPQSSSDCLLMELVVVAVAWLFIEVAN